mgnify:CR=1 FL=1
MIQEVIIVEGKQDILRVKQAIDAEIIATGGFTLAPFTLSQIEQAYKKRGIIILTDPDSAGERIRRFLSHRFPDARHAFVPRDEARGDHGIGIEEASPEAIRKALEKVRCHEFTPSEEFSHQDILENGLGGHPSAASKRAAVGAFLGIGYSNAKQFLYRLNHYGVSREEFNQAISAMEETK